MLKKKMETIIEIIDNFFKKREEKEEGNKVYKCPRNRLGDDQGWNKVRAQG